MSPSESQVNRRMSQEPIADTPEERRSYLAEGHTLRSWLLTTDHKRIAILFMVTITFFFFCGGVAAALIRLDLLTPAPDLLSNDGYNRAFSLHGIIMVWFFLIPSIPTTFGNFLLPLMIGAKDLAFPRLNLLSWYIFVVGGLFTLATVVLGGVDTGWTFYTPFSSTYSNSAVFWAITAVFISGFSSILTGINFIVTVHKLRCPGMTWGRLPIFVWAIYTTAFIFVLATPVLAITLVLVALERVFGIGIFDPRLGGDPILFQHLFWFYSHPAVYIMVLPAMGVVSELITNAAHKRIFGYWFVAGSAIAIGVVGFMVWGHHMFVSGQSPYASAIFSMLSLVVAVPSAIKVYNWTATLHKGEIVIDGPLLYALGFIGLFTIGGLTGVMLAMVAADVHLTDTYFVVAHFHFIMVGGSVSAYFGALHFWWPKMTGRLYNDMWARLAALLIFFGFVMTFAPQFVMGYEGMPRRYHVYPQVFQPLMVMSSIGSSVLAVAYVLPFFYLFWSLRYGKPAGPNPWGATGLEWTTPSPPPKDNFEHTPIVDKEAYCYPPQGRAGAPVTQAESADA